MKFEETENIRLRYGKDVGIVQMEFKASMMTTLMDKANSI